MNDYGDSIENVCHRTGISGNCGEGCEAYMIYEECGFLEEFLDAFEGITKIFFYTLKVNDE